MTLATAACATSSASAVQVECRELNTVEQLHEVTACGLTAQAVQHAITSVSVPNQGSHLSYWPPALCQFSNLTTINLSGNALTFIPQSVQSLQSLRQLLVSRNDLGSLPPEIGALTSLTELDVGCNRIKKLPDAVCQLTNLQVLNAWSNQLACLPNDFGNLSNLKRVGLKGNQLTALPDSFTQLTSLVELFLTDNKLGSLPAGFGHLTQLVKLQASYNPFECLPEDLWHLPSLELFRLAVGNLPNWPAKIGDLPRLAWCSVGGNPAAAAVPPLPNLPRVRLSDLDIGHKLGQGASGEVFAGMLNGATVAVKVFLPGASPDGSAMEEVAITCSCTHPNLTQVLALVVDDDGADTNCCPTACSCADGDVPPHGSVKGLVMVMVQGRNMADRPTSQHLLRCRWPVQHTYSSSQAARVCHGIAGALSYLHSRGVCHGDVYAHNMMLEGDSHVVLCDFGAAFCYDKVSAGCFWEAMEVQAFGVFMQGLLQQTVPEDDPGVSAGGVLTKEELQKVMHLCLTRDAAVRPCFCEIHEQLQGLLQ